MAWSYVRQSSEHQSLAVIINNSGENIGIPKELKRRYYYVSVLPRLDKLDTLTQFIADLVFPPFLSKKARRDLVNLKKAESKRFPHTQKCRPHSSFTRSSKKKSPNMYNYFGEREKERETEEDMILLQQQKPHLLVIYVGAILLSSHDQRLFLPVQEENESPIPVDLFNSLFGSSDENLYCPIPKVDKYFFFIGKEKRITRQVLTPSYRYINHLETLCNVYLKLKDNEKKIDDLISSLFRYIVTCDGRALNDIRSLKKRVSQDPFAWEWVDKIAKYF